MPIPAPTKSQTRPTDGGGNGHAQTSKSNGSAAAGSVDDLDARILGLEKAVGTALFRGILREYGRANHPHRGAGEVAETEATRLSVNNFEIAMQ